MAKPETSDMTVKELIEELKGFNPDALVKVPSLPYPGEWDGVVVMMNGADGTCYLRGAE